MNIAEIKERRRQRPSSKGRYYDSMFDATLVKVMPGSYKTTRNPDEILVTTLGSCVSACIRDPRTGFGGMNHFMLPSGHGRGAWSKASDAMRYGNHAMEILINKILRSNCPRELLEIKVFGGANVMSGRTEIGSWNAEFVLEYLANEGLSVAAQDLGGNHGRRIHYCPATGVAKRLFLRRATDDIELKAQDDSYRASLVTPATVEDSDDGIELFEE